MRQGVVMKGFRLRVGAKAVELTSGLPAAELSLQAGRYRWSVQWWTPEDEASEEVFSEVVVAEKEDVWEGVPWVGANASNEYQAQVNLGVAGPVELLVSTLGFGYVLINDQEVSQDVLSYSGWTRTDKRVLYRTYDVTKLLNASGGGDIFVGLGCGYRCDPHGRFPVYKDGADPQDVTPKIFRMQLRAGGRTVFHSGSGGWRGRQGPVVEDSVYDGEVYVPAAAGAWSAASTVPGPRGAMVPATFPGVQVTRVDRALKITEPAAGVFVVDFGSNVAGVCQLSVPQAATVTMKHGEVLQHAHMPDVKVDPSRVFFGNLRSAQANDTLVLSGPVKNWRPRFTYHGFRYVEVYGYPGTLTADSIQRLVLNTALPEKANATFSDEVLQAIHLGVKGVQRSNLMQVPTDCPQRDERLGWMGDAALSAETFLTHWGYKDMAAAFLDSMSDELGDDGSLPDVVPFQRFGGRPADFSWSAAYLENLWGIWKVEGDLAPAKNHWTGVKSHLGFLQKQYQSSGGMTSLPQSYGDWCPPPRTPGKGDKETPPKGFTSAAALLRSVAQGAELAEAQGQAEAKTWRAWHQKMLQEFHAGYFHDSNKTYANGVMATYVLALATGAVPDDQKPAVVKNLLKYIADHNNTWTGGIITTRYLFDVLHDNGAADLALSMLTRKDYPSFGYMYFNEFEPAKECMWELPDAPFQGTGMNSRAHHMFSSVGHYLISRLAGITLEKQRAKLVVGALEHSFSSVGSDFGDLQLAWSRTDRLQVQAHVPVGLVADLYVPSRDGELRLLGCSGEEGPSPSRAVLHGVEHMVWRLTPGSYQLLTRDVVYA
ncbi:unnamed protein product [Effrenium voratum]|uniref:alpha-L-rhamnosidase n=1 Tax=Effrenium voratum TaxID=2562239 RepID=A0AA36HZP9_9DINO|nr:unnamed protein product [Effrenium voratum]